MKIKLSTHVEKLLLLNSKNEFLWILRNSLIIEPTI